MIMITSSVLITVTSTIADSSMDFDVISAGRLSDVSSLSGMVRQFYFLINEAVVQFEYSQLTRRMAIKQLTESGCSNLTERIQWPGGEVDVTVAGVFYDIYMAKLQGYSNPVAIKYAPAGLEVSSYTKSLLGV